MSIVGIEAMNVFAGTACLDVKKLARHRKLDMSRFENLLMKEETVALPYEDPITFGVNAQLHEALGGGLEAAYDLLAAWTQPYVQEPALAASGY